MMMGETSVCVGNSISGCFIYSNCKYNGRRDNPECIKRKYLRRLSITANKFSNRPRISCWSLVGVLFFSLAVYLPSIVQAQNSTLSSPFISSNISYPPSYTPSSPPISSQIESLGVDDNQPILGQVVPVPAVVTVPSTSAPTEAVTVPSTPPPTEVPSLTVGDDRNATSPTQNPTEHPSTTMRPSGIPSDLPTPLPSISVAPTVMHSESPTVQATLSEISYKGTKFRQEFVVGNGQEFSVAEVGIFESIYVANTPSYAPEGEAVRVTTNCTIFRQQIKIDEDVEVTAGRRMQRKTNATLLIDQESGNINSNSSLQQQQQQQQLRRRHLQEDDDTTLYSGVMLNVDYNMQFDSKYYSVENYTRMFQNWTNLNLETIKEQMNLLNINVTNVGKASRIVVSTPSPTISTLPSVMPTGGPTITATPSTPPTEGPSTPSLFPSSAPTDNSNTITKDQSNNKKIIGVSVTIAIAIIAIGLLFYCIKRRQIREMQLEADAMENSRHDRRSRGSDELTEGGRGGTGTAVASKEGYDNAGESLETKAYGSPFAKHSDAPSGLDGVVVSPNGSLVSNQSLLSRGNSMGEDSKDEADTTQIFADEFDQYKDQNLEKMRADIEENLEGCDGMMSQAVARALIDEDDVTDVPGVLWGGNENVTGPEIEASALGIIMDWLKRNDKASAREKREMMQETLNKMTASVRYGILGPNDASRTIHECAGLLGLQLAAEIPVTTILISGMRKKATENDIRKAFSVFGDVVTAAVASNERGFGILRFTSDDSVDRAMKKFKTEEVVVEDVAVQLRVIKPGSHS